MVVALLAHHGRPDLTQSHAVAPACAREVERLRDAVGALLRRDDEGATLQVALAQRAAYLQFLADDALPFRAHDLQADDAPALAALQGDEVEDLAKAQSRLAGDEAGELLLRVVDVPAIEVGGLLVVAVEHLAQHLLVLRVAEGGRCGENPLAGRLLVSQVGQRVCRLACLRGAVEEGGEIGLVLILPTGREDLRGTTATLAEARVANALAVP